MTRAAQGLQGDSVSARSAGSESQSQSSAVAGDNIVSSTDRYGGTWNLFANSLKQQGIEV